MNKFIKVMLVTAGAAFALGLLFCIIGGTMGGFTARNFGIDSSTHEMQDYDVVFDGKDIKNLDLRFTLGDVNIVYGDEFRLTAKDMPKGCLDNAKVENGTLIIYESDVDWYDFVNLDFGWDSNSFDSKIITLTIPEEFSADKIKIHSGVGSYNVCSLTGNEISIDTGVGELTADTFTADEIKADFDVGDVEIRSLNGKSKVDVDCGVGSTKIRSISGDKVIIKSDVGEFDVTDSITTKNFSANNGTGSVEINGLVADYADCKTGVGECIINGAMINGINLSTGTGEVEFTGSIEGNIEAEVGVGSVKMDLYNNRDNYYIDADKGVGDIRIDGESLDGVSGARSAKYTFNIKGGVGEVIVKFKDGTVPVISRNDDDDICGGDICDGDDVNVKVGPVDVKVGDDGDEVKVNIGGENIVDVDDDNVNVEVGPVKVKTNPDAKTKVDVKI